MDRFKVSKRLRGLGFLPHGDGDVWVRSDRTENPGSRRYGRPHRRFGWGRGRLKVTHSPLGFRVTIPHPWHTRRQDELLGTFPSLEELLPFIVTWLKGQRKRGQLGGAWWIKPVRVVRPPGF